MANEFAINGKSPCVVLCPTRDTAFASTAKTVDLTGYSDGVFSGMTGTAWVADTDAGGEAAIALDGVNDGIGLPIIPFSAGWSLSIWFKFSAFSGLTFSFAAQDPNRIYLGQNSGAPYVRAGNDSGSLGSGLSLTLNQWHNLILVIANDGLSYSGFCDNNALGSRSTVLSTPGHNGIGAFFNALNSPSSAFAAGRFDDLRIWNRDPLDSDDASEIWAAGVGRGKTTSSGTSRPSHPMYQQVIG